MRRSSPTRNLLFGLAMTLVAVAGSAGYALWQIEGLRHLQDEVVDRNRRDSLQLLRIQNNLHSLALALRDMVERTEPYPLSAWEAQFVRIRTDLEDALRLERKLGAEGRKAEHQAQLDKALAQFWNSVDQMFARARAGKEEEARSLIRTSLESQQTSLTSQVVQLLTLNNEAEKRAAQTIERIYEGAERNTYLLLAAIILFIAGTSTYLILANRRIFRQVAELSEQRSVLARKLINVQEEILHTVSRELHDEFGQILTAVGTLLRRAEQKGLAEDSLFRREVQEVRGIVQAALDNTRSFSQALHPSILDDYGLDEALAWYVERFGKQAGLVIRYEKQGGAPRLDRQASVHVYRIVQEALTNVSRHSEAGEAVVRLRCGQERLRVEVEDRGVGLASGERRGLGVVAMKERADILQGTLRLEQPAEGGTRVVLEVPLASAPAA